VPKTSVLGALYRAGKGVASKRTRLGNWLSVAQAQKLLNTPDVTTTTKGLRDQAPGLKGKRYYPVHTHFPVFGFTIALLISTWSILSVGFLIASTVPTARFAQPIGAAILYPMIGLCGLFVPAQSLPPALQVVAQVLPLTYAVSLLEGIWKGEAWLAHMGDVPALVVVFAIFTAAFSEGVPMGIVRVTG
jgi:hypothetical protein